MLTLCRPSAAAIAIVPPVASLASAGLVSPCSNTSVAPAAAPLLSTGTMDGPLAASVRPLTVMVSVVLLVSPSLSVIV